MTKPQAQAATGAATATSTSAVITTQGEAAITIAGESKVTTTLTETEGAPIIIDGASASAATIIAERGIENMEEGINKPYSEHVPLDAETLLQLSDALEVVKNANRKPKVGDVVCYYHNERDVNAAANYVKKCPAIVSNEFALGICNLRVFPDGNNENLARTSVHFGDQKNGMPYFLFD
jgi:hypothetical protein